MHIKQDLLNKWPRYSGSKTRAVINGSETIDRRVCLMANNSKWIHLPFLLHINTWPMHVLIDFVWLFWSRTLVYGVGCSSDDNLLGIFANDDDHMRFANDVTRAQTSFKWIRGNKQLSTSFSCNAMVFSKNFLISAITIGRKTERNPLHLWWLPRK